jgi:hypothetical protein
VSIVDTRFISFGHHTDSLSMPTRTYLTSQTTKRKCRLNGVVPSKRMPEKAHLRKKFSNHIKFSHPELPPKVDIRPDMTPVEDQSSISSWYVLKFLMI